MDNYTVESVKKLDFFEAVRKYPGMYIGSKDADGLHHLPKEIISNSIDEYLNGHCTEIIIILRKDGSISIEDNGRGIPIGNSIEGKTALELCFTEEHAGGKFLNDTGKSGYNTSGGMHGLGAKCVNALSDKMIVMSCRDRKLETIIFENGIVSKHEIKDFYDWQDATGTTVIFYPSKKYLETVEFDADRLRTMIQEFSFLCRGLEFTFINEKTNESISYLSKNGLYDYLEYLNKDKDFLCKPFYFEKEEGNFKVEVAFGYNNSYSSTVKLYTNNIPQIKGTHLTGFKTAFTSTLNAFAREKKWLKDKDENLQGSDFEEGQLLVINFKMIDPVFKGQAKEELSSSEGRTYVQKFSNEALKELFTANEKEIKKIVDKALSARKAREAAKKAREVARKGERKKTGLKAKMELSDKFIDCKNKDPKKRNLLLVEGLSAGGSALEARNVETDCIYMLRGKIISPLKQPIDKLLSNQEISDIIRVINAGFGNDFDINKMDFDKIVITSDQDSDGFAIELLLITFFYTYMRPLVEAGKLYRAVTPLYIITTKKDKHYCYTEQELDEWKENHSESYELSHCKGLGEVSAKVLKEICFENQRFKRITVSDAKATEELLNILEGPNVAPRKQYIYDNASALGFNFV